MNTVERRNMIKSQVAKMLSSDFIQIDNYTYVLPIDMPDGTVAYGKIEIKACSEKDIVYKDGHVNKAFNVDDAIDKFNQKKNSKENKKEKQTKIKKSDMIDF